jgi:hypothetical protein
MTNAALFAVFKAEGVTTDQAQRWADGMTEGKRIREVEKAEKAKKGEEGKKGDRSEGSDEGEFEG